MTEIAAKYDVTRETIYLWEKELAGGPIMKQKEKTKDELKDEIKKLKQEHQKLKMENKILRKANELIKKEMGANFNNLTNKEKTVIISTLKSEYKITELIKVLNIKKSTYFYELKHLSDDKYKDIKIIFNSNYNAYGYRRMKIALNEDNKINISEKVIIRLMRDDMIFLKLRKNILLTRVKLVMKFLM